MSNTPEDSGAFITPTLIRCLVDVADARGVSLDPVLRAEGLTPELLTTPTLKVSARQSRRLVEEAVAQLGEPALGIFVGSHQPMAGSGIVGLALITAPTVGDAMQLGMRFQQLGGALARWQMSHEDGQHVLSIAAAPSIAEVEQFYVDEAFAAATQIIRDVISPDFRPHRVEFSRGEPESGELYREFFRTDVVFGAASDAWTLTDAQWNTPILTSDPWTHRDVVTSLEREANAQPDPHELMAALTARVEVDLPWVETLAEHARALTLSERTLRRRLASDGLRYSDIVAQARRKRVTTLLKLPRYTLLDIATAVGYSDERSLRRAIYRWFGASPRDVRASLLSSDRTTIR